MFRRPSADIIIYDIEKTQPQCWKIELKVAFSIKANDETFWLFSNIVVQP